MKKPFKFFIYCNITGEVTNRTNQEPLLHQLQTWVETDIKGTKELKQTKTAYIDTRYKARLRLYNYLTYTKNNRPIPEYNPYKDTEVGKSMPILNF